MDWRRAAVMLNCRALQTGAGRERGTRRKEGRPYQIGATARTPSGGNTVIRSMEIVGERRDGDWSCCSNEQTVLLVRAIMEAGGLAEAWQEER